MRFFKSRQGYLLQTTRIRTGRLGTISQEQRRDFLAEKSKHNSRRILFFSLFCTYALLAVLGTSDYDFLLENPIEIPGLRITLPLRTFYIVTPLAILILHFGVLWMYERYRQELENIPHETIEEIPFSILDTLHLDAHRLLRFGIQVLVYLFPPLVLFCFLIWFIKYQHFLLTSLHLFCLIIDLVFICKYRCASMKYGLKTVTLSIFFLILILFFVLFYFFLKSPSSILRYSSHFFKFNLEVTHYNLNKDFDLNKAKAYRELDAEKKKRPCLFYITMVNLQNRKLIQADLSYSKMVNFDFSNADLSRAILTKSQLQYSSFKSANLQGANMKGSNLQEAVLKGANLQGANLTEANLQVVDMSNAKLQGAYMKGTNLQDAVLNGANLQGANLSKADLQRADMSNVDLQRTDMNGTNLQQALLKNANLQRANLTRVELQKADLSNAKLQGAVLEYAKLQKADLSNAKLQGAVLEYAKLQKADLSNAKLQGVNLTEANLQGADMSNANLQGAILEYANLQGAILEYANLQGAILTNANLQGAHLKNADLQGAKLEYADLQGANLAYAELQGVNLWNGNMQGAYLKFAKLYGANLWGANLQGADLSNANLQGADIGYTKLQGAILKGTRLQGAYTRDNFNSFVDLIGKSTELSHLWGQFTPRDYQKIVNIIKYISTPCRECLNYNLKNEKIKTKWIDLVKRAVGKTSLEWLKMQKGEYITGVLTWEEACKIQKEVSSPEARKFMGLDRINWEERCKDQCKK